MKTVPDLKPNVDGFVERGEDYCLPYRNISDPVIRLAAYLKADTGYAFPGMGDEDWINNAEQIIDLLETKTK